MTTHSAIGLIRSLLQMSCSADVQLSKRLSYVLRHGAVKEGLPITADGFVQVRDLLRTPRFRRYSVEDIERVVTSCSKQRFTLIKDDDGSLSIRANQGHSLPQITALELKPILTAEDIPLAVHGTYFSAWRSIKSQGLSKMKRNHIHMAAGLPGDDGVISGMRAKCEVLIFIDVEKAMQEGLKFYLSSNGVILSEGDVRGFLSPHLFLRVQDREGRSLL